MLASEPYEDALRRRTRVFLKFGFLALAAAGALVGFRVLMELESEVIGYATSARMTLGFPVPPPGTPDTYLLVITGVLPLTLIAGVSLAYLAWHRSVSRRVKARWQLSGHQGEALSWGEVRRHSRISRLHASCPESGSCPACRRRAAYLDDLLSRQHWDGRRDLIATSVGPAALAPSSYEAFATATFEQLSHDIGTRALATGLVVGLSRNRLIDALTVVAATYETHLHVLSELGKRPTLAIAWRIKKSALAALFVNLFLNQKDILVLNVVIRKAAIGVHALAEGTDDMAHHLSELDLDLDDFPGGGHVLLEAMKEVGTFSLSVGSAGLRAIGNFIDHFGTDLVQGCVAAGILWHQASTFAADILARDEAHRERLLAEVTPIKCATGITQRAGEILQGQIRELRGAFRQRRSTMLKRMPGNMMDKIKKTFGWK